MKLKLNPSLAFLITVSEDVCAGGGGTLQLVFVFFPNTDMLSSPADVFSTLCFVRMR